MGGKKITYDEWYDSDCEFLLMQLERTPWQAFVAWLRCAP